MQKYRVCDPDGNAIEQKDLADSAAAYNWFKTVAVPDDALGYRLEVDADGEWLMVETSDGGSSPHGGAD